MFLSLIFLSSFSGPAVPATEVDVFGDAIALFGEAGRAARPRSSRSVNPQHQRRHLLVNKLVAELSQYPALVGKIRITFQNLGRVCDPPGLRRGLSYERAGAFILKTAQKLWKTPPGTGSVTRDSGFDDAAHGGMLDPAAVEAVSNPLYEVFLSEQ